jgi:hypothetical protein
MRVGVGRQHLPDLPNTGLAVCTGLAAGLDLPDGARPTSDFFRDAAVRDTFANTDEHGGCAR